MKKDYFWKVIVIFFLAWLFLWLWNSSIYIYRAQSGRSIKHNKLTGRVYALTRQGWQRIANEPKEISEFDDLLPKKNMDQKEKAGEFEFTPLPPKKK